MGRFSSRSLALSSTWFALVLACLYAAGQCGAGGWDRDGRVRTPRASAQRGSDEIHSVDSDAPSTWTPPGQPTHDGGPDRAPHAAAVAIVVRAFALPAPALVAAGIAANTVQSAPLARPYSPLRGRAPPALLA